MCQLWALHVVVKRQFLTFILAVFLLNYLTYVYYCTNIFMVLQKQTEVILEYYFWFRFFCELNHRQHSYDGTKVFKMAAIDVTNQLPVPF